MELIPCVLPRSIGLGQLCLGPYRTIPLKIVALDLRAVNGRTLLVVIVLIPWSLDLVI